MRRRPANPHVTNMLRMQDRTLDKENLRRSMALLDMKRLFVRSVCHEVRTPLSIVMNSLYMLESLCAPFEDTTINETLEEAKLSCQSANDMMQALLTYEQLEGRTLSLTLKEVDLHAFIEKSLQGVDAGARLWDITFKYDMKVLDQVFVNASVAEFDLAIRSLVKNAIKFTPPGGLVHLKLYSIIGESVDIGESSSIEDWIRFEVTDTGPGLSKKQIAALLRNIENFQPTFNNTEQGGGVTVCVVHGIVDLHGGRMGVVSPGEGQGSSYFIDMPIARRVAQPTLSPRRAVFHQGTNALSVKELFGKKDLNVRSILKRGVYRPQSNSPKNASLNKVHSFKNAMESTMSDQHRSIRQAGPSANSPTSGRSGRIPYRAEGNNIPKDTDLDPGMDSGPSPGLEKIKHNSTQRNMTHSEALEMERANPEALHIERQDPLYVLIVDDVPSCRKMLAKLLKSKKCTSDEAKDGLDAVEKVRQATAEGIHYDGIFMDASMPNMTGSEATKAIRALGYTGKIYGVTGNSLPEDITEFLENGANEVKIKPVSKDDIEYMLTGELKFFNFRRVNIQ